MDFAAARLAMGCPSAVPFWSHTTREMRKQRAVCTLTALAVSARVTCARQAVHSPGGARSQELLRAATRAQGGSGAAGAGVAALGAGTHVALAIDEAEFGLHPPAYPWPHEGLFSSYDHASIRRGYQVYQQATARLHLSELAFMIRAAFHDEGAALHDEGAPCSRGPRLGI